MANLEEHFLKVHRAHQLPVGDFPDVAKFRDVMSAHDLTKFPKIDLKMIQQMETVLAVEIPKLMSQFPQEGAIGGRGGVYSSMCTYIYLCIYVYVYIYVYIYIYMYINSFHRRVPSEAGGVYIHR